MSGPPRPPGIPRGETGPTDPAAGGIGHGEPERWNVAALRRARPIRARGNFGTGAPCPMCRMILSTGDLVFEVKAELDGHEVTINFHPRCYDRWKETAGKG